MVRRVLVLLLMILLTSACRNEQLNNPSNTSTGKILLKLNSVNIPSSVMQIRATLTRQDYSPVVKSESIERQTVAEIVINSLDIGIWNVLVEALDAYGDVIYSGSAVVEVSERQTAIVSMTLSPVGSGKGDILLIINWPGENDFTDNPGNPVLNRSGNTLDRYGVYESNVLKDESGFHMWYTGYQGDDISYIFYAYSEDGETWYKPITMPVIFPGAEGKWDDQSVTAGPVIKKDGMYMMYYHGRQSRLGHWHTGLATSQDGLVWEKYNSPVLYGEEGKWDYRVSANHVEKVGNVYYMYYTGISRYDEFNIGMAMSDDGLTWSKYGGNPVLKANKPWEGTGVYWPTIYRSGDTYKMIYMNKNGSVSGFGEAVSYEGISWTKSYDVPVFTNLNTTNKWDLILYPDAVVNGNELILYYSAYYTSINEKFICYATKSLE